MSLLALRRRLPIAVFVLLAVVCLIALGFACACASDHPSRSLERAIAAVPVVPVQVELWPVLVPALAGAMLLVAMQRRVVAAARTPAQLQRFLL